MRFNGITGHSWHTR